MLKHATPAQREAITFTEGTMLVLAGPGSGKTFTIAERIRYLIEEAGVPPGKILTITFTKAAACEMEQRCHKTCPASADAVFGTFHSVYYQILKHSAYYRNYTLISENEKREIMRRVLYENGCETEALMTQCEAMLARISLQKNKGKLPGGKSRQTEAGGKERQTGAVREECQIEGLCETEQTTTVVCGQGSNREKRVMAAYEKACADRQKLDFDDMLTLCFQLLSGDAAEREMWQNRFSHILVDEFQDISLIQYETLKLICGRKANLFVVGDDDQAIYSFRGSDPGLMRVFLRDYPKTRQVLLAENFRCGDAITALAAECIRQNKNRFPKQIRAAAGRKGETEVRLFADSGKEQECLCDKLQQRRKEGKTVAILVRTNRSAGIWAETLHAHKIACHAAEVKKSLFQNPVAQDVLAMLRFVFCGQKRRDLFYFMNKSDRHLPRSLFTEEKVTMLQLQMADRKFAEGIAFMRGLDLYGAATFFLHGMGYLSYRKEVWRDRPEKRETEEQVLALLLRRCGMFTDASGLFSYIQEYEQELTQSGATQKYGQTGRINGQTEQMSGKTEQMSGQTEQESDETERICGETGQNEAQMPKVEIMTYHASKGLEFDHVFLPGVNRGEVPHGRMLAEQELEEERRMFYVAVTRAKKSLFISGTGKEQGKKDCSVFLAQLL